MFKSRPSTHARHAIYNDNTFSYHLMNLLSDQRGVRTDFEQYHTTTQPLFFPNITDKKVSSLQIPYWMASPATTSLPTLHSTNSALIQSRSQRLAQAPRTRAIPCSLQDTHPSFRHDVPYAILSHENHLKHPQIYSQAIYDIRLLAPSAVSSANSLCGNSGTFMMRVSYSRDALCTAQDHVQPSLRPFVAVRQ